MRDADDEMLALLRQIAQNTGSLGDLDQSKEVTIEGESPASRVGMMDPRSYICVETDDLDGVDEGGTVTLEPGDTKRIVSYQTSGQPFVVLAVGANDEPDVSYKLEADNTRTVGGVTNSPLGLLNDPFSFVKNFGAAIPAEKKIAYVASLDANAPGPVELAGRLHVEVI